MKKTFSQMACEALGLEYADADADDAAYQLNWWMLDNPYHRLTTLAEYGISWCEFGGNCRECKNVADCDVVYDEMREVAEETA